MVVVLDENSSSKTWFLNIRCSNHMTCQKSWLIMFDESRRSTIKIVSSRSLQEEKACNMVITSNGKSTINEDVLYVLGIK